MEIAGMEAEAVATCDAACRFAVQAMQNQATLWQVRADQLSTWFWVLSAISVSFGAMAAAMPDIKGKSIGRWLVVGATISSGILGFWRPDSQSAKYQAAYGQLQVALIEYGARDLQKLKSVYGDSMRILTQQKS